MDQAPLIQIVQSMGLDFISSIQESRLDFLGTYQSTDGEILMDSSQEWGVGFYLLHNGRDGYYCHNDFSRSTSGIVEIANQLLKYDVNYENKTDVSSDEPRIKHPFIEIDVSNDGPWFDDPIEQTQGILALLNQTLNEYDDKIEYNIEISGSQIKKTIQNSSDSNIVQTYEKGLISIEVILKENRNIKLLTQMGGIQASDFSESHLLKSINNITDQINELEVAKSMKPGKEKVIYSPDTSYSLLHESIGHGVEADQILEGTSYLNNRLGHKVASSELTITDDPRLRGAGWLEYDDEGTKTKGTLLIEDGILTDYLHTRKTSALMDTIPTGNARSTSYYEKPEPRQTNLFVEPKDYSLDEMLEEVKNGYLLGPTIVASTSLYTGDIYIETQYGRKIDNGELGDFVLPQIVSGNALQLLRDIEMVGDEVYKKPTECLKSKSRIDIGAYTPYLGSKEIYIQ